MCFFFLSVVEGRELLWEECCRVGGGLVVGVFVSFCFGRGFLRGFGPFNVFFFS